MPRVMSENAIFEFFNNVKMRPSERRKRIVDKIRHARMDSIKIDTTNNEEYNRVYTSVMTSISNDYPFLSGEVQRQMEKKKRWQAKRINGSNVPS